MEKQDNRLINGKIAPVLLEFAIPFMVASFLQSVYGAVDLFVVGRYTGSAAVSAVSIGSQLMMLATILVQGVCMGGTVLIGQRIGEENWAGAANAVGNQCVLFAGLAVVVTPLMLAINRPLVAMMQTPVEAVADCRLYLMICTLGFPFIVGYNAVSGIYRGLGDSRTPVYFIAIACAVNVALDFVLVGGFEMGAEGAAVATIAAQGVSFLCGLVHMIRKGLSFPFSRHNFRPRSRDISWILKVGLPLAMQDVLVHFSFLAISAIINTLGLVASAAVGVAEKFMGFAFIPSSVFSSAVATMVAQNVGAGQRKRAVSSMRYGIGFSLICGVLICLLCQTVPEALIGIFSKDEAVITAGAQYIRTYSIDCVLVSFVFCMNAYFNGNGQSFICFAHSIAATFLIRIPVTWLMSRVSTGSLLPMGLAAPAASLFSIVVCLLYFWRHESRLKQSAALK
ncbi:MAG: MATE family efflux transporter [Lachnospiraceae bacterium]|nr:MATE family efflux transporter [Lachnospiraceae bacterium]